MTSLIKPVRMLKSAFQTDEDQQMQKIASHDAKVSAIASLSDAETLNRLRDLEQPIQRIADHTATYAKSLEDARYRLILDWLSPVCFLEHQKGHSERRIQGTGEWLLNHREYLDWHSSSTSSIFLLHGMAGSGKSSLASAVVDAAVRAATNQPTSALRAYFYCSKNPF